MPRRASSIRRPRELVYGPINKPRWIYACSKQLHGPRDPRLRHAARSSTTRCSARSTGSAPGLDNDPHGQGRQLARHHAVPRPHRARRADPAGRWRRARSALHLHRRRHRGADEDHREPRRHRASGKIYNIGNPRQQLLGARAGRDDARARRRRIPNTRDNAAKVRARRDHGRRVLRHGLPGRAEPRAEDRQHLRRPRLAADGRHGARRCAQIFEAYREQVAEARAARRLEPRPEPRSACSSRSRSTSTRCAARARACRALLELLRRARRAAPPSCSASGPITPAARSGACSAPASSARSRAPRCSSTTACGRCSTARCCPAPTSAGARRDACARCATPASRSASTAGTTSRWQDDVRAARRGVDASARCSSRVERFTRDLRRRRRAVHGAAGWQMNEARAARSRQQLGFALRLRHARHAPVRAAGRAAGAAAARSFRPRCRRSTSCIGLDGVDAEQRRTSPCSSARRERVDPTRSSRCTPSSRA